MQRRRAVMLLSFSGIDGAGKTTGIDALRRCLAKTGCQILLLSFWDDIAVFKHLREELGHSIFGGDRGVGRPDKPLSRRDKNVRSWYMTAARLFFYFLDTVHTNLVVARAIKSTADVVIFDRYIYDEFANLFSCRWPTRIFVRLLLKCTPKLDISYLLDADPRLARERKPEYPFEFLKRNRESYLDLSEAVGMTTIPPLPAPESSQRILEEIQKYRSRTRASSVDSPALQLAHACDEKMRAGTEQ